MPERISGERPWRRSRIVQTVPAPAVATDWSQVVEAGHVWDLLAVFATLATDANAADRAVRLQLGDGNLVFLELPAPAVQAASLSYGYSWARDVAAYNSGTSLVAPLPRVSLMPGWSVGVATTGLQAGDQWSAVQLLLTDTTVRSGRVDLVAIPDLLVEVTAGLED